MEAVTQNQLSNPPSFAIENQRSSHELPANMIPSNKGLAANKTLQNFTISRHVEFKDLEVSVKEAREVYSARDRNSNYPVDQMQAGDGLAIKLQKFTTNSQEFPPPDKEDEFFCEFIAGGSTKNVFKINRNNKDYAIAIPGRTFRDIIGWQSALLETASKEKLRQLGLNIIPFQTIVLAKVDGVTVPAIAMPLFTDIGGHIADHQNARTLNSFIDNIIVKNQITGDMLPVKDIPNEESFLAVLQHAIQDAGTLVKNKIALSPSSINFLISESGDVELFLFDLPRAMNVDAPQINLCDHYANKMLKSFYGCMHRRKSLAFDPTTSNSNLVAALSALINQAAGPEPECSQKRNHPENPSPHGSSFKKQK